MSTHIEPEDLALFAMHLLTPEEMAPVEFQLERSPAMRQELAAVRGDLAAFAYGAEMHAPSPTAKTRFLKMVAEEKRSAPLRPVEVPIEPAPRIEAVENGSAAGEVTSIGAFQRGGGRSVGTVRETPRRSFVTRVLPWAGWAIAAGMALMAGNLYRQRQSLQGVVAGDRSALAQAQSEAARTVAEAATARDVLNTMNDQAAMRVTLTRKGAALPPTGRTTYSAEKGVLIFVATNLEPIDTFKVYELWLIPANGGAPIPAGTFHPDPRGYANLISVTMPKGVEAKAFGITIENEGGAEKPTLPIVMTGA